MKILTIIISCLSISHISINSQELYIGLDQRITPINLGTEIFESKLPLQNRDSHLSGPSFSFGGNFKLIGNSFLSYQFHIRYSHLYYESQFDTLTVNSTRDSRNQVLFDHVLGIGYNFNLGPNNGLNLVLGGALMNLNSDYSLIRIIGYTKSGPLFSFTTSDYIFGTVFLRANYSLENIDFNLTGHLASDEKFGYVDKFILISMGLRYFIVPKKQSKE